MFGHAIRAGVRGNLNVENNKQNIIGIGGSKRASSRLYGLTKTPRKLY